MHLFERDASGLLTYCSCEERLYRWILAWNTSAQMIHLIKWEKSQDRFDTMRKRWTFTSRFFDVCVWSFVGT